jgi:undecaprenyl-diphosphatase
MTVIEAIILGVVQGLTEFIPVSSSGHLIIMHELLGVTEDGLAFDVALHIGTLLALVGFFYRDILSLVKSVFIKSPQTRLAWLLMLATVPAVISGVLLQGLAEDSFRSLTLVCFNLALVGVIMLLAEWYVKKSRRRQNDISKTSTSQAVVMGVAQAAAVVPGVSRSGSTITAGLFMGLDRVSATRFSFLLGIPITFGAILKVLSGSEARAAVGGETAVFFAGILAAMLSGLFAISFMLKFLAGHGLHVFAYYRIALAAVVILAASF